MPKPRKPRSFIHAKFYPLKVLKIFFNSMALPFFFTNWATSFNNINGLIIRFFISCIQKLHWFFSQRKCVCYSVCGSHRKDDKNIQNVIKYIYKKYEWHVQSSWFFWKLFKNSLLWRRYCRRLTSCPVSSKNQYQLEIRPQWWMMMNFFFYRYTMVFCRKRNKFYIDTYSNATNE